MSNKDIENIFGSIKKVLNPELEIPVDEKDNPLNYRIVRTRELLQNFISKHKEQLLELEKLETNLSALLVDLNKGASAPKAKAAEPKDRDKDSAE